MTPLKKGLKNAPAFIYSSTLSGATSTPSLSVDMFLWTQWVRVEGGREGGRVC